MHDAARKAIGGPAHPVHDRPLSHRAADALFGRQPDVQPVWPAKTYADADVAAVARDLFGLVDPQGATAGRAVLPKVRSFFPPSVLQPTPNDIPLSHTLAETVLNGAPLYLEGAARGTGSSYLAIQYMSQFNRSAAAVGDARRAVGVKLFSKTRTLRHLFDALALALKAPLTASELRFRSTTYLAQRVLATAAQSRVVCLVLDHVHHLDADALDVLGDLIRLLDPEQQVDDGDGGRRAFARVAVVLVSHKSPEALFLGQPQVADALEGRHAVLRPYTHWEQVGEALERADIGIEQFDPTDDDDRAMARLVLTKTSGLPSQMNPFFARLGRIAQRMKVRPNARVAEAVLPYHRQLVELRERLADDLPGGREYSVRVTRRPTNRRPWLTAGSSHDAHEAAARAAAEKAAEQKRRARERGAGGARGRGRQKAPAPDAGGDAILAADDLLHDTDALMAGDAPTDAEDEPRPAGRRRRGKRKTRAETLAEQRKAREQTDALQRRMNRRGTSNL